MGFHFASRRLEPIAAAFYRHELCPGYLPNHPCTHQSVILGHGPVQRWQIFGLIDSLKNRLTEIQPRFREVAYAYLIHKRLVISGNWSGRTKQYMGPFLSTRPNYSQSPFLIPLVNISKCEDHVDVGPSKTEILVITKLFTMP